MPEPKLDLWIPRTCRADFTGTALCGPEPLQLRHYRPGATGSTGHNMTYMYGNHRWGAEATQSSSFFLFVMHTSFFVVVNDYKNMANENIKVRKTHLKFYTWANYPQLTQLFYKSSAAFKGNVPAWHTYTNTNMPVPTFTDYIKALNRNTSLSPT